MGGVCMKRRKIIALLLSFMLLFSLLPNGAAWAEDQDGVETSSPSDADEGQDIDSIDEEGLDTDKVEGEIQDVVTTDTENQDTVNQPVIRSFSSRNLANTLLRNAANYTLEFTVQNDTNHTISKNGDRLSIDGGIVELRDSNNTEIQVTVEVPDDAHATMTVPAGSEGYLNFGGNNFTLYANGQPFSMDTKITGAMQFAVQDYVNPGGQGGDQPAPGGDHRATINLSGPQGNWIGEPMVRDNYDNDAPGLGEYQCSVHYDRYAYVVSVGVNGGRGTDFIRQYNSGEDLSRYRSQNVDFNVKKDGNDNELDTVDLEFFTNWGNRIESIYVNGEEQTVPFNFDDRNAWLNAFHQQGIVFVIENVPRPKDAQTGEYTDVYDIEVKVRPMTEDECFIGNFLWSSDDRLGEDDDRYIGHSQITIQSIEYNDGNGTHIAYAEDLVDENGNERFPFIHQSTHVNYETGIEMSEMVAPEGSWVTMKIETERGYQVDSFDINGESIKIGAQSSVFSFRIGKGNFHIGANIKKQEDDVKLATSAVEEAAVEIPEGTIDSGTARLYVEDANISADKEAVFEEIASAEGAEIEEVLDISLAQVFFQGTGNDNDVWRNDLEDLDEPALVGLKLKGDYTGKTVEFIHNIHDGDEYEVVEPVEFDPETGEVLIPADSFSSYAIATKPITAETPKDETKEATVTPAKEATVTPAKKAEVKSTKPATSDNFNIMLIGAIAIVSAAGIVFVVRRKRMLGK